MPLFETGGQGLQYYPHVKIRLSESAKERDKVTKEYLRSTITGTTTKSRLVGKGISAGYYFNFVTKDGTPTGIDHFEEMIYIAEEEGIIFEVEKQNWDIYGNLVKRKDRRKLLVENMDIMYRLYADVMSVLKVRMGHDKFDDSEQPKDDKPKSKRKARK